ncbi:MAG: hypothetical protein DRO99_05260, partial [Candidatus Aenigmatarchaeota archaeon]
CSQETWCNDNVDNDGDGQPDCFDSPDCQGQPCLFGHCCSGSCISTDTSITHCGSCGNACPPGNVCFSGECVTTSFAAAAPGFEIGMHAILVASLLAVLFFMI